MKILKRLIFSQSVLFFLAGSAAHADEFYTEITAMNAAVKVTNCDNSAALAKLAGMALENSQQQRPPLSKKENESLKKQLGCVTADKPSKYVIRSTEPVLAGKARYGVSEVISSSAGEHRFIMRSDLMPYFEIDTTCKPNAMGGQVNRMETDKAGRLYLKKYLVTSTCVNGKSKSNWKPLN